MRPPSRRARVFGPFGQSSGRRRRTQSSASPTGCPPGIKGESLLHLGAFARHIGLYPGPAAIEAFADELEAFSTSKGAIQLPHDRDLPVDLVRHIVRWRLEQVSDKRPPRAKSGSVSSKSKAASRAGKPRCRTIS
jgi:hypothetical protein